MAQSKKVNKTKTEINTTALNVVIVLLVVVAGISIYSLTVSRNALKLTRDAQSGQQVIQLVPNKFH
ncbi:MAG TPA: hypothetical protein VLF90_01210 [Patescibacteria group bacterium]|nr:hypothetical protein [Patescibacteria group bacterium]